MTGLTFVATIAKGGGDRAFVVNFLRGLAKRWPKGDTLEVSLVVVSQSGVDDKEAARAIVESLSTAEQPRIEALEVVGVKHLQRREVEELIASASVSERGWQSVEQIVRPGLAQPTPCPLPSPPSIPLFILQGPLLCFTRPEDVVRVCFGSELAAPSLPRLITIREFGQGCFCLPSLPSSPSVDLSAGLCGSELGVFDLRDEMMGMSSTLTSLDPALSSAAASSDSAVPAGGNDSHFLGYFRTDSHASRLGRLVGLWFLGASSSLLSPPTHLGGKPPLKAAAVIMPCSKIGLAHFKEGLRHAGFEVSETTTEEEGEAEKPGAEVFVADQPSSLHSTLKLVVRPSASSSSSPPPAVLFLSIVDVSSLQLPLASFRHLMTRAEGIVATGDSSLNEALSCCGPPFSYSAEPHKRDVEKGLKEAVASLAAGKGSRDERLCNAAAAVQAFWAYLEAPLMASSPGLQLDALASSFAPLSPAVAVPWPALRLAFSLVCNALLDEYGGLVERVVGLIA